MSVVAKVCGLRAACALALVATLAAACGDARPGDATTRVLASASLTRAFGELVAAYEAAHPGASLELHTAGTPRLVLQLREGAPAAVLATADRASAQRVVESGRALGAPTVFATNRLAVIARDASVADLADLARDDLVVLLCGPEVPAGRYARAALAAAGVAVRSASDEPSVSAVVAKVRLGEADAGVVYTTDAAAVAGELHGFAIEGEAAPRIEYPLLLLDGAEGDPHAAGFADFVRSAAGAAILEAHGFSAVGASGRGDDA